jgi:DNA-binding HxlR family transcriptional regulator
MKEEFCRGSTCPITKTAGLLSDTWTMLIARALLGSPKKFSELEGHLEGISTRTLTAKLRSLEEEGLIKKSKEGKYAATAKGKALRGILLAMGRYGEKYL